VTLPNREYTPTVGAEPAGIATVSTLVAGYFVLPESSIGFRELGSLAVGVSVPEAAMYKDDSPSF
jgi:hypothetical protein